jgi:catechol 2,3-dioxygenase-like lactoylglutathione lyase family enzyme
MEGNYPTAVDLVNCVSDFLGAVRAAPPIGLHNPPDRGYEEAEEVAMLGDKDVIATVAVKDLDVARKFYEGKLGLKVTNAQGTEALTFQSGSSALIVYRSQFAGTNKATALNWRVGDGIDKEVAALRDKGVTFERYDMPGMTREGDLHVMGNMKSAWFKDPDGNIIALMSF